MALCSERLAAEGCFEATLSILLLLRGSYSGLVLLPLSLFFISLLDFLSVI
uniref:Uncharacterized protein n=1 Tax=Physcomitrium patens TaxID=3218 RepID=A0A2K1KNR8_PHYPA|nr:hypothetical protein PHYPA_006319 [Physcomitrium patens]